MQGLVLEHGLHGDDFVVAVGATVLDEQLVDLACVFQVGVVHALVPVWLFPLLLLVVDVEDLVERLK